MLEPAAVLPLHPIRVLLVGRDRRFLRVTSVLLRQSNCVVEVTERPSELLDRIAAHRANVVILDGSDSLSATARAIGMVEALPSGVATVVVHDGGESPPLRNLTLVPKWGPFDALLEQVRSAYARRDARGLSDAAV